MREQCVPVESNCPTSPPPRERQPLHEAGAVLCGLSARSYAPPPGALADLLSHRPPDRSGRIASRSGRPSRGGLGRFGSARAAGLSGHTRCAGTARPVDAGRPLARAAAAATARPLRNAVGRAATTGAGRAEARDRYHLCGPDDWPHAASALRERRQTHTDRRALFASRQNSRRTRCSD